MSWYNKENLLRTIRFENPSFMPYDVNLCSATWVALGGELEYIVRSHPKTWPEPEKVIWDWKNPAFQPWEDPDIEYVDLWGSVFQTSAAGYVGALVKYPLKDLDELDSFCTPGTDNYNGGLIPIDWREVRREMQKSKADGLIAKGGLDHGFHMLRLEYLRGFENLMCDLMDGSAQMWRLVEIVHGLNKVAVQNWIDVGAELIELPEDLGTQNSSILGPKLFRKWALPYYKELHDIVHRAGRLSRFHCDGNIMDIADLICEVGPDIFNPQDKVNGVENLAKAFKERICVDLDFDRQYALAQGSPKEIFELLEYEIKTLGSPRGGLMIRVEVQGDIPPENIDAVVTSLEKLSTYWFE